MAVSDLAARPGAPWQVCATCHALDTLPKQQAKTLRELLSNPGVRYSELADELRNDPDWLLDIDRQSLSRHARGRCGAREKLRGAA